MTNLFDNDSRNIFAHMDWFMFKEKGVTTSEGLINFDDIQSKMENMYKLYQCITTKYHRDMYGRLTLEEIEYMKYLWNETLKQLDLS